MILGWNLAESVTSEVKTYNIVCYTWLAEMWQYKTNVTNFLRMF